MKMKNFVKKFLAMVRFRMLLLTIYSLMSLQNFAQNIQSDGFFSGKLQTDMDFLIALPENYDTTYLYPVIYVLDTDLLFYETVAAAFYNAYYDYMPPVIVIGINYITPRNRADLGLQIDRLELTGKGKDFADYIHAELIPYIHKKYAAGKSSIMGYSYTGSYLYWWLLHKNTCFDNYIVLSPETTGLSSDKLGAGISANLLNKRLICITAKEDFPPRVRYAKNLIKRTGFPQHPSVYYAEIPRKGHTSAIPYSVPLSLELLFKEYINQEALEKKYPSALTTLEIYEDANQVNIRNYGIPLRSCNENMVYFMDRALEAEKDPDAARLLLAKFTPSAFSRGDMLQISNIIYYERMLDTTAVEKHLRRAVEISDARPEKYNSWNIRVDYARNILARQYGDYGSAWKELDKMIEIFHMDTPLMLYYKGQISAQYNFQNQEGIECLLQALKNKESLAGYNITEDNILCYISGCYYNLKDTEQALTYIQKALSVAPNNNKYKELQKKYTSI